MSDVFELPSLGADMEHGTVLEWYVQPGDHVDRGSLVALVSTEKADVDVEIWQDGVIAELLVAIGDEVPVGTPLLRLEAVDAGVETAPSPTVSTPAVAASVVPTPAVPTPAVPTPAVPTPAVPSAVVSTPSVPAPVVPTPAVAVPAVAVPAVAVPAVPTPAVAVPAVPTPAVPTPAVPSHLAASPRARGLAGELGVDLATVTGSGPGGAVLARDVMAASSAPAAVEPVDRSAAMRRVIAERMSKANAEIPHYHLELDVDLGPALAWLTAHNEARDINHRVLPAALFIRAVGAALLAVPELNGTWSEGSFSRADGTDVAVVVSLRGGGLVTPKISRVGERSLDEVMGDLRELVVSARRGSLRSSWMSGAGITVTNLGDQGADRVHGVIFPPQVALVGFGRIAERPWVVAGAVVPRPVVTVSLAADHRVTDGATGSRFLHALADLLQHPDLTTRRDNEHAVD